MKTKLTELKTKEKHLMKTNVHGKTLLSLTTGLAAKRSRFGWLLALTVGFWAVLVQAQELRYHYVALDQAPLPAGFVFFGPEASTKAGAFTAKRTTTRPFSPMSRYTRTGP